MYLLKSNSVIKLSFSFGFAIRFAFISLHQEIFFWGCCCGLRQIAANRTVAADVYGR